MNTLIMLSLFTLFVLLVVLVILVYRMPDFYIEVKEREDDNKTEMLTMSNFINNGEHQND